MSDRPTTPAHHPGEEWLWGYAAGALAEATSLLIAAHVTLCPGCRAAVGAVEAIAGTWLDCLDGPDDPVGAVRPSGGPEPRAAAPMGAGLPGPLLRYAAGGVAGLSWRLVGPGIERAGLIGRTPGLAALMMRLAPGAPVPRHTHDGEELTLVLEGAYQDEIGRFAAGDVADLDRATTHRPRAERDEPCLCLVILDGRLRFTSPIARAIQPFVGF